MFFLADFWWLVARTCTSESKVDSVDRKDLNIKPKATRKQGNSKMPYCLLLAAQPFNVKFRVCVFLTERFRPHFSASSGVWAFIASACILGMTSPKSM